MPWHSTTEQQQVAIHLQIRGPAADHWRGPRHHQLPVDDHHQVVNGLTSTSVQQRSSSAEARNVRKASFPRAAPLFCSARIRSDTCVRVIYHLFCLTSYELLRRLKKSAFPSSNRARPLTWTAETLRRPRPDGGEGPWLSSEGAERRKRALPSPHVPSTLKSGRA